MTKRLTPKDRKRELLQHALELAAELGYMNVTRLAVATRAGVTPGLVSIRFGSMPAFRRDLMRYAVREQHAAVVGQGLALRDAFAARAPDELKQQALQAIRG